MKQSWIKGKHVTMEFMQVSYYLKHQHFKGIIEPLVMGVWMKDFKFFFLPTALTSHL